MRSSKILLALGLVGLIGVGLALSGCSSDDRPTPPEPTINDQYTYVQSEINDVVDETITLMASTLDVFESNSAISDTTDIAIIDDMELSSFDPDSVLASNNWYILISDQLSAAYGSRLIDSIQFTAEGTAVKYAGQGDGIIVHHLYEYANIDTDVTYTDYNTKSRLTFSGLNTTEATISGSWSAYTIAQVVDTTTEIRIYTIEADVNNIVVGKPESGWAGGCPISGSIDFSVDLSYQDGDDSAELSTWDFTVTFTDGSGSVSVSDGAVSTSYSTAYCTP